MIRWRGGAVAPTARLRSWRAAAGGAHARAWLLVGLLCGGLGAWSGCSRSAVPVPGGPRRDPDAAVFQPCTSICVRPGDCAEAFNDDGICPAGFLCILRYSGCSSD